MNAPEPSAASAPADAMMVARAPLGHFAPSLTNRTHSDAYIRDELAPSLNPLGVLQPITARPWPTSRGPAPTGVLYEIIIGEGRWLASAVAGLSEIPFFWRNADDKQALEMQLIENLKRRDLTAIEEADGYRRLMKDHGHTADTIAERIGKSRAYVYGRLKLLDLGSAGREAFAAGKLDASTALLVARIPGEALQKKAVKEITESYHGEPLSYRAAKDHIRNRFTVSLAQATFPLQDAALLPAAGSCTACPKRSGNAAEICADLADADVCTDTKCFDEKRLARREQLLAQAEQLQIPVITGPQAWTTYHDEARVNLDAVVEGDGQERTYREILGEQAPRTVALVEVGHGDRQRMVEMADATAMAKALQKAGWTPDLFKEGAARNDPAEVEKRRTQEAARQAEREANEATKAREDAWRASLRTALAERIKTDGNDGDLHWGPVIVALAQTWLRKETEYAGVPETLLADWGLPISNKDDPEEEEEDLARLCATIAQWPTGTACAFLFMGLSQFEESASHSFDPAIHRPHGMLAMAEAIDFDADALRFSSTAHEKGLAPSQAAQAQEEMSPETEAPANDAKAAGKKTKAKANRAPALPANEPAAPAENPRELVHASAWPFPVEKRYPEPNEHGVYDEAAAQLFECPAGKKGGVRIHLLEIREGWIWTVAAQWGGTYGGSFSGPLMATQVVADRDQALRAAGAEVIERCTGPKKFKPAEWKKIQAWAQDLADNGSNAESLEV